VFLFISPLRYVSALAALSAMQAVIIFSVFLLASAAEDQNQTYQSLRGSRSLPAVVGNTTATTTTTHAAEAGVSEDAMQEGGRMGSGAAAAGANDTDSAASDLAALIGMARGHPGGNVSGVSEDGVQALLLRGGGWHRGGDKVWGGGTGMESITRGNVHYYDAGMYAARARCGGAGCALITNPAGHRTVRKFHIHFVHYHRYGSKLHRRLESKVCGRYGWHGGFPCGGRASYFPGFPAVFSRAMAAGGIRHASVIAWPGSCGGRGTIVELAYGCSIEHAIRR